MAYQLYLPQQWASDRARRKQAGVPREIDFRTKGAIALEQIEQGIAAGLPPGIVLADAAYGTEADWRDQLTAWGLSYAVGVREHTQVWSGAHRPAPIPAASPRGGRPRTRLRIDARHRPLPVLELAQQLPARSWRTLTWREGTNAPLRSRFAALRVRAANERRVRAEQWLLIEWPRTEAKPVHYWLCTLPASTALQHLVATAMGRWRIERDYQELKSELGLHHYEGRNWRGFHHHGSLCIAAYGFLMRERLRSKKKLRSTQNTCHTLRLPPARVSHRCSDTFPTRSRRWPSVSVASSPGNYRSVRAAERTCSGVNIISGVGDWRV